MEHLCLIGTKYKKIEQEEFYKTVETRVKEAANTMFPYAKLDLEELERSRIRK